MCLVRGVVSGPRAVILAEDTGSVVLGLVALSPAH